MNNFQLWINIVNDRIMSTSIISFVQNFSANDIEIMVFEFYLLSPATSWGGGIRNMVKKSDIFDNERIQSFYGFTFEFPFSRWRNDFRLILHFRLNHVFFAFQILMLRFSMLSFYFCFWKWRIRRRLRKQRTFAPHSWISSHVKNYSVRHIQLTNV